MHKYVDNRVILRLAEGDEKAFNEVYALFCHDIYGLAYRYLQNSDQSEEVLQETFISLWLSREKLLASGDIWNYLYVIAKRKSLDILRDIKKSRVLSEKLIFAFPESKNYVEEKILADELGRFTDAIIDKLPEQQKKVYHLSRSEGLSHAEIADRLKISPNTVKNHMICANKTLRLKLQYLVLIVILFEFF